MVRKQVREHKHWPSAVSTVRRAQASSIKGVHVIHVFMKSESITIISMRGATTTLQLYSCRSRVLLTSLLDLVLHVVSATLEI